jgi:hypothetical protein
MKKIKKEILDEFQEIKELLDEADQIITGVRGIPTPEYDHRASFLLDKNVRDKLFESHPECFIPSKTYGNNFLCVCNREGALDPFMVDFSLKLADRISANSPNPPNEIKIAKLKLESLQRKLGKKKIV